jgi:hypothetical protein
VTDPAVAGIVVLAAGVATAAGWVDWPALGQWLRPRTGLVAMFGIGGVLLAAAVTRAVRRAPHRRRRGSPRALSWWVIAAGGVVVAGVAWGATAWLLSEAEQARDPAAARVEAIKTGLAIGAGTGGVFALLLAVRRQWHQELSAAATEHDAAERRVTELYTKAVEQLGSPQAPVRLGGLYALERVAQNMPEQRQTVVNVLCAYLRMPFTPPSAAPRRLGIRRPPRPQHPYRRPIRPPAPSTTSAGAAREELEVRLAAQRILAMHLQPGIDPTHPADTFWEDIDLDLAGATLVHWTLDECRIHNVTFAGAQFTGDASFHGTQFVDTASFSGAQFAGHAGFTEAQFADVARFTEAQFDHASFTEAQFASAAEFSGAQFAGHAWFIRTQFAGVAAFVMAQFAGQASFSGAQFADVASFAAAQFAGTTWFDDAQFAGDAGFGGRGAARFRLGVPAEIAALLSELAAGDDAGDSTETTISRT